MTTPRILHVRHHIQKKNDLAARALRQRFTEAGVFVVSLVSGPGAGKTTFLRQTLATLRVNYAVAALVGDLATDNDARTLAESGAPVRQIVTGTVCHLDVEMVRTSLAGAGWALDQLDFLFIENVGSLVCPSGYDLGENLRVVLMSTTEGEDKPLKYPTIFHTSDLAIITKSDLAIVAEFDRRLAYHNIQDIRPGLKTLEVSARNGSGMDSWVDFLCSAREQAGGVHRPQAMSR